MAPIPVKPKKKKLRRPKKSKIIEDKINEDNSKIIEAKKAEELEAICRICHDTIDPTDNLAVRPCRCRNYLHHECFQEWFKTTQRTKCEICLTDFVIQNRRRLNKTQLKQNWCRCSHYVLYLVLFLVITAVTYVNDLKYLIKPPTDVKYFYLNIMAATLACGCVLYWLDAIFLFDHKTILKQNLKLNEDYSGFFAFQIHAIIRPMTTGFRDYIFTCVATTGSIAIMEAFTGMFSFVPDQKVLMGFFVGVVVAALFLELVCFKSLTKSADFIINIRNLMMIICGQTLFHIIGTLVLGIISSRWQWVIYIVTQPKPNVFTFTVGGLTWILGLLLIAVIIRLVVMCSHFCCPRENIPQLAPYQKP